MPASLAEAQYDLEKLVFTALFAFALGVAGNIITFFLLNRDSYVRELERQTKKLAFWKSYHEMQANQPEGITFPTLQTTLIEQRFREDLESVFDAALGWKRQADRIGLEVGIGVGMISVIVLSVLVVTLINWGFLTSMIVLLGPPGSSKNNFISTFIELCWLVIIWRHVCRPLRNKAIKVTLNVLRINKGQLDLGQIMKGMFLP